jgi:hypothetical protein
MVAVTALGAVKCWEILTELTEKYKKDEANVWDKKNLSLVLTVSFVVMEIYFPSFTSIVSNGIKLIDEIYDLAMNVWEHKTFETMKDLLNITRCASFPCRKSHM